MGLELEIVHVFRSYNGNPILRDCSFAFASGRTYVLQGPNGSGKSTLFRALALLEKPDSGRVEYRDGGRILAADLALRRRITLVLPRTGVFNTTVFKNVAYGLKLRGLDRPAIERKVQSALEFVGLGPKAGQHGRTLSSGETQRLGLARALVLEPEVLFLDEPTASIDQENTEIIEEIIGAMKKESRSLVIMTTHDRDQAERLADQLLVIQDGILIQTK